VNTAPIGSIIAFCGREKDLPSQEIWVPCDGRRLDPTWTELADVLGARARTIPDLRGLFLRGSMLTADVEHGEKATITGTPAHGLHDDWGARLPGGAPQKCSVGQHQHEVSFKDHAVDAGNDHGHVDGPAGSQLTGGVHGLGANDVETRPHNYAVIWLMKVRNPR